MMQQAALTDILNNLDRPSPTSTEVLRAQTPTWDVQGKCNLSIAGNRRQGWPKSPISAQRRSCPCSRALSTAGKSPQGCAEGLGALQRDQGQPQCLHNPSGSAHPSVCPASCSWLWALQRPLSSLCLGLCIWLLLSINNWRYWFLGILFCFRKLPHALVLPVFSKSTTSLPTEQLQAIVFVRINTSTAG